MTRYVTIENNGIKSIDGANIIALEARVVALEAFHAPTPTPTPDQQHKAYMLFVNAADPGSGENRIQVAELEFYLNSILIDLSSGTAYATNFDGTVNQPSNAFDGIKTSNTGGTWTTQANFNTNQGVAIVLPVAFQFDEYRITILNHTVGIGRAPRDFRIQSSDDLITEQASFDAATWADIDIQTSQIWTQGEEKSYII